MPQGAFRTFEFLLNFTAGTAVFTTYATDIRFLEVNGLQNGALPRLFSDFLGKVNGFRMRLLEMELKINYINYNNIVAGEYNLRNTKNWKMQINNFLLDGVILRNILDNDVIEPVLTQDDNIIDFGQGIVINDFEFPNIATEIELDVNPPVNNSPLIMQVLYTLKYTINETL